MQEKILYLVVPEMQRETHNKKTPLKIAAILLFLSLISAFVAYRSGFFTAETLISKTSVTKIFADPSIVTNSAKTKQISPPPSASMARSYDKSPVYPQSLMLPSVTNTDPHVIMMSSSKSITLVNFNNDFLNYPAHEQILKNIHKTKTQ